MTPHPSPVRLVLSLVLVLGSPAACRPQQLEDDAVVIVAAPPSPLETSAAGTRRGSAGRRRVTELKPQFRSSQGPEGFAYESSHPVLDAYGALSTATQYHAQDGLGRYRYSFRQPGAAREEYVDENGRIQGSYSYDMPNEKISMTYYADDTGFHVKRAVLPNLAALAPRDEPDVAAIKAMHMRLWRSMWARAAAASVGAPLDPLEVPQEEVYTPEDPVSLESDIISSDPANDIVSDEVVVGDDQLNIFIPSGEGLTVPIEAPLADPVAEDDLVPVFPGAPDAPSVPVADAPKPLPSGAGVTTPDSETVIVSARIGEFSASGGDRPQQQFGSRPLERLGALRLRGSSPDAALGVRFAAAASASAPAPARVRAGSAASAPSSPPTWLGSIGGSLPAPAFRVSDEAARSGRLPVAERHSLAQVRPSQRRQQDETAPVLDDPVLYRYSSLLHTARQAATPPRIVVV